MSNRARGSRQTVQQHENGSRALTHESVEISSPYPPPAFLEEYERVLVGSAERLLKMAEAEQRLEHELARAQLQEVQQVNASNINTQRSQQTLFERGQIFALLSMVGILAFSAYALTLGFPWVAGTAVTTSMLGMAVIYVLRQRPSEQPSKD
jgi:uncharacterized membrane protein